MRGAYVLLAVSLACAEDGSGDGKSEDPAPIESSPVSRGPIEAKRVFSGSLESPARFDAAARVPGRIAAIEVDLGDEVTRGQVVARLDPREYRQRFVEAEADAAVAKAAFERAEQRAEIARRDLERAEQLEAKGVSSRAQLDAARSELASARGDQAVASAQKARAQARLDAARLQLAETEIRADWSDGGPDAQGVLRRVARRWVSPGAVVEANATLLTIVALSPLNAVIFVEERDYARLRPGLPATLVTDAVPDARFEAQLARVAPVLETGSRQARVELRVQNEDERLKPGMFVRVELVLERIEDAQLVPVAAVTTRDDVEGLFQIDDGRARWTAIELGVREADRVQVLTPELRGEVITLGLQLVKDGTPVVTPRDRGVEGS